MQKFKYTAINLQKQQIKGTFIAKDEKDLGEQLAKQGLYILSAAPYTGNTPSAFFTLGTGKVPLHELTTFCRQFSIMLNTHITILDSLGILKNQPYSDFFHKILEVVYDDIKSGLILSAALDKHAKVFPDFFRSMVHVGEMSGKLDEVFLSLADYYEKDRAVKAKIKGAMSYPLMLLAMTIAVLILMFSLVIPRFRDTMSTMDVEITGLTKFVYDLADWFGLYGAFLLLGVVLLVGLIIILLQTEKGKYVFDILKMKLPLIKTVQINMITARFARGLGLLLSSGMDLNEALASVEIIIGNRYIKKKFHEAAESVRQGMSLTVAFEVYKLFPTMMQQMVAIGEKTGDLEDVLMRSCGFFDGQVETSLNSVTSKIQPIMLMFMGVVIGGLFIAVYSPMLSIMNGLG